MPSDCMRDIAFMLEPEGKLLLTKKVCQQISHYRQARHRDKEAGGILLGRLFENKSDIIIDEITTPLKHDKRARHTYYRSSGHHKIAVDKWKQSNGYCLYLGLWHTHPEKIPTPSSIDISDWKNAISNGKYEGDRLFFIIVGTKQICCWQGDKARRRMRRGTSNVQIKELGPWD